MNRIEMEIQRVATEDTFRAAYLMKYGEFKEAKVVDDGICYIIKGDCIADEDNRHRTGNVLVNLLIYAEAFVLLNELIVEAGIEDENTDGANVEIEEDIDLLVEDGEEEPIMVETEEVDENSNWNTESL